MCKYTSLLAFRTPMFADTYVTDSGKWFQHLLTLHVKLFLIFYGFSLFDEAALEMIIVCLDFWKI